MATAQVLPQTIRRLMVTALSSKFRDVVKVETIPLPALGPGDILVKNRYLGINASDVNFSSGRYLSDVKPPFSCGFEGVGQAVWVGEKVKTVKAGQPVAYMCYGAFSDYIVLREKQALPIPAPKAEYTPLIVSGLTASIALDEVGQIKKGETVLVTAAAGGTGIFAVQWAKLAGCHVVATCSGPEKVAFVKALGADRVIDYEKEDVSAVLTKEYPSGINVAYESVGGSMFDAAVNNLAMHGRLVVIGYITGYQSDRGFAVSRTAATLPQRLLPKSASVRGFFLFNHASRIASYWPKLVSLADRGELKSIVDFGESYETGPFNKLESIFDAVEYLYTRRSKGKVLVSLPTDERTARSQL